MIKFQDLRCAIFLLLVLFGSILATSYDGTTPNTTYYLTSTPVFANNEYAKGYVKFQAGATISSGATAFFNVIVPFSGTLDLSGTGTLSLQGSLFCDSNFSLAQSGVIKGNGNTVFLGGNLTIPNNAIIHINSDTIIDGQGNDLILGRRGRLFVDTNVTLTLKNMRIVQSFNDVSDPCIRLAAFKSKLALEDIELALAQDFLFNQGQFYVHGDVAVTGTSAFIYRSTQKSFVAPDSTLYFDVGTTFSVTPATFTDCKFDHRPTYTLNNFIVMAGQSSKLHFSEASLCTTVTGCKFTKGTVNFENRCNIKSNSSLNFLITSLLNSGLSASTGSSPSWVAWSPNGSFIAVVNYLSQSLQIFNSTTLAQIGSSVITGTGPVSVSWNNSSSKLAVVNSGANSLQVFNFDGINTPTLSMSTSTGSSPSCVAWSTWGSFIAVTNSGSNTLQIFNSSTLAQVGSNATTGTSPSSVSWASGDQYLAVTNFASNTLQIFSFNYTSVPTQIAVMSTGSGSSPGSVAWAINGIFIAVANQITNKLDLFTFGSSRVLTLTNSFNVDYKPVSTSWSVDNKYVAIVTQSSSTMQVFSTADASLLTQIGSDASTGDNPYCVSWSPAGNYLAVVNSISNTLQVFPFTGSGLGSPYSVSTGSGPTGVAWSPAGNYLAVVNISSNTLQVFPFTGSGFGVPYSTATISSPRGVAWSPVGNFIAVTDNGANRLEVFTFTGSGFGTTYSAVTDAEPWAVEWSPSGNFIAVGNVDGNTLQVFPFTGSSIGSPYGAFVGSSVYSVSWALSEKFIAIAVYSLSANVRVIEFTGSGLGSQYSATTDVPVGVVSWSTDGRFISSIELGGIMRIFSFNGSGLLQQIGTTSNVTTKNANNTPVARWAPDSKNMAVIDMDADKIRVFSLNPILSASDLNARVSTEELPSSLSFAPDNSSIAVVNQKTNSIEIFRLNPQAILTQACPDASTDPYAYLSAVSWAPSDRFVAVASGMIEVFPFNGTSLGSPIQNLITTDSPSVVKWSPDERFIGLVYPGFDTASVQIWQFDGASLTGPFTINTGSGINAADKISWSPDGRFLAVLIGRGYLTAGTLRIYAFYGNSNPVQIGASVTTMNYPDSIDWSSDGRFIALATQNYSLMQIYSFNGLSTPTTVGGTVSINLPISIKWSPDGRFIASLGRNGAIQLFKFDGSNVREFGSSISSGLTEIAEIDWSPDGRFLVASSGRYSSGFIQIYLFNQYSGLVQIGSDVVASAVASEWSKDGKFLAVGLNSKQLRIYRPNYIADRSAQAITNGVVFGNSALGSSYDTTVKLLAGSNVMVDGLVNYDCVN